MQSLNELICPECKCDFESASELLKHFATHAIEDFVINTEVESDEDKHQLTKRTIPDLRPIMKKFDNCADENVYPLTYCEVTLNDGSLIEKLRENFELESNTSKKYVCLYCKRCFGWPTDLKRHLLTHTGEKPFKCNFCKSSYTRKFILQKHINKYHRKLQIPDLKPISKIFSMKFDKGLDKSI